MHSARFGAWTVRDHCLFYIHGLWTEEETVRTTRNPGTTMQSSDPLHHPCVRPRKGNETEQLRENQMRTCVYRGVLLECQSSTGLSVTASDGVCSSARLCL